MTQEEKAKVYDKALERAKKLQKTCDSAAVVGWCEYIFPEIRESEDEKIRKGLIKLVKATQSDELWCEYCVPKVDALAWLEKQGEQKQEINNFDVLPGLYKCVHRMFDGTPDGRLLFEVGNVYRCLSKHDRAEFEVSYGHSVYLEDPVVCKHFIPFEKQGEQKPNPCDECINVKGCINCENGELRETEQKSVDKAESKFKVGDWVVYYRNDSSREVLQVYDIRDGRYYFTDNVHFSWSVKECDEKCHLWTIEDARDGDVLACENGWTCIFKCLNDNLFSSYCFMDHEGWFCEDGGQGHTLDNRICGEIYPATNEQRDTLMKAIADAGYTFDFDKRELKKIEQKSAIFDIDKMVYVYANNNEPGNQEFGKPIKCMIRAYRQGLNDAIEKVASYSPWSGDDEKFFKTALWHISYSISNGKSTDIHCDTTEWLKSIKDRCNWKPSDEQMEIIDMLLTNETMDDNVARVLRELKEQLKKLKGE